MSDHFTTLRRKGLNVNNNFEKLEEEIYTRNIIYTVEAYKLGVISTVKFIPVDMVILNENVNENLKTLD